MILYILKILSLEIVSILLVIVFLLSPVVSAIWVRVLMCIVVSILYICVSMGDAYLGAGYVKRLCGKEDNFVVNSTIPISGHYWKKPESDIFRNDVYKIEGITYKRISESEKMDSFFEIYKFKHSLTTPVNGKVVAHSTDYVLYRSWYEQLINVGKTLNFSCGAPPHNEGLKGEYASTPKYMNNMEKWVFIPINEEDSK